jgi:peptidoglycan/xylan/chitin deacetylase (PgdA/CDA1 family)
MFKQIFDWTSPAGKKARLSILIFHRVLPAADPLFPNEMQASHFDDICGWLKTWFNVLPLDQAVNRLKSDTLPARAACITFDDGYADNFHVALPILQRHGLSATFFIATGFLDGGRMWNDTIVESIRACTQAELDLSSLGLGAHALDTIAKRQVAIAALIGQIKYRSIQERLEVTEHIARLAGVSPPDNLMMTSQEVKAMRQAGMQIGAHTVSHPILARLTDDEAREEILASKNALEQILAERVGLFAYPNGKPGEDYSAQSVAVVRGLGFDAAVSTSWGCTTSEDDCFQIRRFTPWDKTRLRFGIRLLANLRR